MADYKKMYYTLFNKITDVIAELQEVQQQTEEIFIGCNEEIVDLEVVQNKKEDSGISVHNK